MTSEIIIRLSPNTVYRVAVKALLILGLGIGGGYFYDQDLKANNGRAETLTLEEYTAEFESYRAGLQEEDWGTGGNIALLLLLGGLFFGVYEAVPWAVAVGIQSITGPTASPYGVDQTKEG